MAATDVLILAGGLGTRLRTAVPDLPKPLAPVAGRPFLTYLLDRYANLGMRRAIIATGYLGEMIEQAVGSLWKDMEIVYSRETSPLGTGGALLQAARYASAAGLHVCNGDTYLEYSPAALEQAATGLPIAIALASVPDVGRYGAVDVVSGRVKCFREKGVAGEGMINAGCYFLSADGLAALPALECFSFEQEVLQPWVEHGCVGAMQNTSSFIDIGIPEDFARAQHLFSGVP
jgi:D-glycero-alpha-D-manno-heptose 1-phosphate guanylyltransferase